MISKANLKFIQPRSEVKLEGAKVGQAVYDILSKSHNASQEVGETISAMTPRYYQELMSTVEANKNKYDQPYYIVVFRKKEPWSVIVLRQWFIARQTKPLAKDLREDYPNHDFDLWNIDPNQHSINFVWTLPTAQDSRTILANKECYDPALIETITKFNEGKL